MRIDSLLFVIAALDVEASENYIKEYHDNKGSKYLKFLPQIEKTKIITPMDLWVNHLKTHLNTNYPIKSLRQLAATLFPEKSEDTAYRELMRWKSAKIVRHLPKWDTVDKLLENAINMYQSRVEYFEFLMTWGRITYGIVRIFHCIIILLLALRRKGNVMKNFEELPELRARYSMWFDYHLETYRAYINGNCELEGRA